MAQFYAAIRGNRGEATRMGTATSGMDAHIRGWNIGVRVHCYVDGITGEDVVEIRETKGSNGYSGADKPLATLRAKGGSQ